MTQSIDTGKLHIAYEQHGEGKTLLLLHGWPDSVRTWDKSTCALTASGYKTIAPYARGFGATTFHDPATMRSGQIAALAQDVVDLMDALNMDRAVVLGHDWGARTGYALAALFPERVERLIVLATAYETGVKPGDEIRPEQAHALWYQWLWHTQQGREALEGSRREFCRYLWQVWAPQMAFTDEEFDAASISWDNPDWVEVTLHSYRVRWGSAPKDPAYAEPEARLATHPAIAVPTTLLHGEEDGVSLIAGSAGQEASFTNGYRRIVVPGVGHFPQRERPDAVVEAVTGG